jgi:glutathione S-transferase
MIPPFPALVLGLALLLYVGVFIAVGRARLRYGVKAPAVTGAPEFERAFRVQQNTVEQLIWFYASPLWAGIIGLVWVAARAHYAFSYHREPDKRGPGFVVGFASAAVLLVGALLGILADLF